MRRARLLAFPLALALLAALAWLAHEPAPGSTSGERTREATETRPGFAVATPAEGGGPDVAPAREIAVSGVVRAPSGEPLSDVTVTLYRAEGDGPYFRPEVRTSAARRVAGPPGAPDDVAVPRWAERRAALTHEDGAYEIAGVPAGGRGEIVVRRADRFVESKKVSLDGDLVVDVVLRARPSLTVRLRRADGSALASARHQLWIRRAYADGEDVPLGWAAGLDDGRDRGVGFEVVRGRGAGPSWVAARVVATTDDEGVARWWLPQGGAYRASVFEPGHRAWVVDGVADVDDGDRDLGEVRLEQATEAGRVRLVGADGAPFARRRVVLTTADDLQTPVLGPERDGGRDTDDEGWFSLEHVVEGDRYHVWLADERAGGTTLRTTARLSAGAVVRWGEHVR